MGQKKHFVESTVNLCFMFLCFRPQTYGKYRGGSKKRARWGLPFEAGARVWTLVAAAAFLSDIFITCCNVLNSCSYTLQNCAHTPLQLFSGFSSRLQNSLRSLKLLFYYYSIISIIILVLMLHWLNMIWTISW